MANETKRTEWVVVFHGQHGTFKMAAMNPVSLAQMLAAQTAAGNVAASVYEREAQIYTAEEVGR